MSAITTPQYAGIRTKRVTTGSVTAGLSALVTVTWPTTFADTNYTFSVMVLDATAAALGLTILHVESISFGAITVRVLNTAITDLTGTLHAIAVHD